MAVQGIGRSGVVVRGVCVVLALVSVPVTFNRGATSLFRGLATATVQ